MSTIHARRLAEWSAVFAQQEAAMTADEYARYRYEADMQEAELRAEMAAERYYEEGPAHRAFYFASMADEEAERATWGLPPRW